MSLIEIERKRIINPDHLGLLVDKLKNANFGDKNVLREVDTYYTRNDVDYMKTVECLRVRQRDGFAEITYKPASNKKTSDSSGIIAKKESNAILRDEAQAAMANELLETIGLVKLVTVDKTRKSFKSDTKNGITVAIDTIVGAGIFIEVEVMSEDIESAKEELEALELELGITEYEVITLPYRDIVMGTLVQT
jgi:adenylate cyclase class 2